MEPKDLIEFKNFNYLKRGRKNKIQKEKAPFYGKHRKIPPMVTIVIPTYNRPNLLKIAIDSALKQRGFSDYQILVSDSFSVKNEDSDTKKLIREYDNEKIIYYCYDEPILGLENWNSAMFLARSEWICMLHDDDFLKSNYLYTMTKIVNHNNIDYLGCKHFSFEHDFEVEDLISSNHKKMKVDLLKVDCFSYFVGGTMPILGGFIRSKCFREVGGFIDNRDVSKYMFMEDNVLSTTLSFYYRAYFLECPLYGYRSHQGGSAGTWQTNYSILTCFHTYNFAMCLSEKLPLSLRYIAQKASIYQMYGYLQLPYVKKTNVSFEDMRKYFDLKNVNKITLKYYKFFELLCRVWLRQRRIKNLKYAKHITLNTAR